MPGVDLAAVMDALAARVAADLGDGPLIARAYGWPKPSVNPPAFVVGYPETLDLDAGMRRGSDRLTIPCWAVFGNASELAARDVMSGFLQGIKDRIDGVEDGVWSSARATDIVIDIVNYGEEGAEYLVARFNVDIIT